MAGKLGSMFQFDKLLEKACKVSGKFKKACHAIVMFINYKKELKKSKSMVGRTKGIPCEGHPATMTDKSCMRKRRQTNCERLPAIFSSLTGFFQCNKDEDNAGAYLMALVLHDSEPLLVQS